MASWTFTHQDGTACTIYLECERSHAPIDTDHEEHDGPCGAFAVYGSLVVPVDAYADATALGHRLAVDTFEYWNSAVPGEMSVMTYAPDTTSGYRTQSIYTIAGV